MLQPVDGHTISPIAPQDMSSDPKSATNEPMIAATSVPQLKRPGLLKARPVTQFLHGGAAVRESKVAEWQPLASELHRTCALETVSLKGPDSSGLLFFNTGVTFQESLS